MRADLAGDGSEHPLSIEDRIARVLEVVGGLGDEAALGVDLLDQVRIDRQYFLLLFDLIIQLIEYLLWVIKFDWDAALFFGGGGAAIADADSLLPFLLSLLFPNPTSFFRLFDFRAARRRVSIRVAEQKVIDFRKSDGLLMQQRRLFVPARDAIIALLAHLEFFNFMD